MKQLAKWCKYVIIIIIKKNNFLGGKMPEFLVDLLKKQYGEEIVNQILQGYFVKRKTTFRVNMIKSNTQRIEAELKRLGIVYKNPVWSGEAFILENANEKELQELDIYKNGEIYLQSLSSMLPAIVLNPKKSTDILDMTAAPGGKTTQLASITQNEAHITACEMNHIRAERLKYNLEKQGASSVYLMEMDSRKMDDFFAFDYILLDSPCSGSGTLNGENSNIEKNFTMQLIEKSTKVQFDLLKKALKILKSEHEMVYSTCSILELENEEIVKKILALENAEIVPIEFSRKGIFATTSSKIKRDFMRVPK